MQENNKDMQGNLNGASALTITQDTKKLNAGLAILVLQDLDFKNLVPKDCTEMIVTQAHRIALTDLNVESKTPTDTEVSMHCMNLIEEYLKEQGV